MILCAGSDDEMDAPDITPLTKKGKKRKSSEELDFSGFIGQSYKLLIIYLTLIELNYL